MRNRRMKRQRRNRKRPSKKFVKTVRHIIEKTVEKKYRFYQSGSTVSSLGYALYLTDVPIGTSDTTRIGDQISLRSVRFKITATVADTTNWVRVILFQYIPQIDSSTFTPTTYPIANILIDTTTTWLSPYSHDNRYNFRILYDKTHLVVSNQSNQLTMFKGFIKKFPRDKIQYYAGSTTTQVNAIHMLILSDSGVAPHPSFTYSIKLNFSDS